jgi:hypothetical protein
MQSRQFINLEYVRETEFRNELQIVHLRREGDLNYSWK